MSAIAVVVAAMLVGRTEGAPPRVRAQPAAATGLHRSLTVRTFAPLAAGALAFRHSVAPPVIGHVATDFALRLRPVASPAFIRLGLASVLSAGAEITCTAQHSRELIAVLATSPFAPVDCRSARRLDDDAVLPPVLAPGHNKNALFGPAFSPRRDDDDP